MVSNLIARVLSVVLLLGATDLMAGNPASTQYVQQNQGGGSTPSGTTYTVGQYAQGGVIFWVTLDGQHGLVASIENMPSGSGTTFQWSPGGVTGTIGATGNDISMGIGADGMPTTTGKINSALIVAQYSGSLSSSYAAGACNAYSVTVSGVTYDDWYLPCVAELGLMQSMQSTINSVSVAHGGTSMGGLEYWSSFEKDPGDASSQYFTDAIQLYSAKNSTASVRAVRAF